VTGGPQFSDWLAVANLKARYCRLLDSKDWEGWGALFADDAVVDTTASGGSRLQGREAVVASVRASLDPARTVHHIHSPEITVEGDLARAVWAMQDMIHWPDGRKLVGFGHYHERYTKGLSGWQIAETRLTRLHLELTAAAASS
jgi:hypothetical protein